jgi:hypothetical protein
MPDYKMYKVLSGGRLKCVGTYSNEWKARAAIEKADPAFKYLIKVTWPK